MELDYQEKQICDQLRMKLNADKIKLWLPPYTTDDGLKGEYPQEMLERYSKEFSITSDRVQSLLENFRKHALEKLSAKKEFNDTGLASLKVKLAGDLSGSFENSHGSTLSLSSRLSISGADFKKQIESMTSIERIRMKLICGGKVLDDDQSLESQGVKNLASMMLLILSETEAEAQRHEERAASVVKTRRAAEFLSNYSDRDNDDHYYLQIADQSGKPIDLPNEERKALALAMTLHEKGRAAMKRKNYGEAVLLLLEADEEFSKCRADILKAVDNYAIVCLDIVWCYLCLQNVEGLPDAEKKLKAAEDCFKKSYGTNMERLSLVKGCTGEELALFMRLHLMQGILAYHQHRITSAKLLLEQAGYELSRLQVDETKMTQVMEMGFSQTEARLGLRACDGHVESAVAHIMKKQKEKKEIDIEEKEKKRRRKIAAKLGKTANGSDVDVRHYDDLHAMGFAKGAAAEALRQTNNDIMAALQVLHDHPELLDLSDPDPPNYTVTDEMIAQVTAMGFDRTQARAALHHFRADSEKAIEKLLEIGGIVPQAWIDTLPLTNTAINSDESTSTSPVNAQDDAALEKEAIAMIIPDLHQSEEDHLDLGLEEEAAFLQQYMAYIASLT